MKGFFEERYLVGKTNTSKKGVCSLFHALRALECKEKVVLFPAEGQPIQDEWGGSERGCCTRSQLCGDFLRLLSSEGTAGGLTRQAGTPLGLRV